MGRYTPHPADEVLANRYGDCKDKHTLFAALLQAAGLQAYPVLIGSRYRLDAEMSSPSLFDHVITAIPRGDGFLFLDTTPEVAPYELLLANLRDRKSLVMPLDKPARLVTTPANPPFRPYEVFHIDSSIDTQGTLDAEMRLEEHSDTEVVLRTLYRSTPQNQWDTLTQKLVASMGFGGTVSEVAVAPPEDTSKPFTLKFHYHRTDFSDWKNHRIVLPAPFFFVAELTEGQKASKSALPIGTPSDTTYETTVKLPERFSVIPPVNVDEKHDFGEFSAKYEVDKEHVLHGTLHLKLLLPEVPGTEREKFTELAKTVGDTSRSDIFVKGDFPSDAVTLPLALQPGVLSEDQRIALYEKAVDKNPVDQQLMLRLGNAYIRQSRAKDAVTLFEKALTSKPDESAWLYFGLGNAYVALAQPDQAFEAYQKSLTGEPDAELLNEVAYAMGDAGIHEKEALGYAERAVSAVAKKTRDISSDDAETSDFALMGKLAAYWDTLGWIKYRMGDSVAAEPYLQAAWELSQYPAVGAHLAELYEKRGELQKAATFCNMALAGMGSYSDESMKKQMERLRPYLKTAPGHHGVDGAMALSDIRTFTLAFHAKLKTNTSYGHFVISLVTGPHVDNVIFTSGDAEMRNAVADLAAAKFPQSFPDATPARVLRKATVSCSIYSKGCTVVLMPIDDAAVPGH
jgi:Tfp pilus assembly protein PilF